LQKEKNVQAHKTNAMTCISLLAVVLGTWRNMQILCK